ncbi:MAG: hypothetical protein WCS42_08950, partial [Verrucomicrobiota bacterium]
SRFPFTMANCRARTPALILAAAGLCRQVTGTGQPSRTYDGHGRLAFQRARCGPIGSAVSFQDTISDSLRLTALGSVESPALRSSLGDGQSGANLLVGRGGADEWLNR